MLKKKIFCSAMLFGMILTLSLTAQDLLDNLHIHGFVSQGYLKSTENNYLTSDSKDGSMDYNEATINFITTPAKGFHIGTQLYARDLDLDGNLVVTIDWAYGDYRWKDYLGIRVGRFKNPLGLYSKVRDVDMARVPIFLPQSVYGESERDMNLGINGVGLYGNRPVSFLGDFDYEVVYGGYNLLDVHSAFFTNQYRLTGEGLAAGMTMDPSVQSATLAGTSEEVSRIRNVRGFKITWNTPVSGLLVGYSGNQLEFGWDLKANVDMVVLTGDPSNPYYPMSQSVPITGDYEITTKNAFTEFQWNKLTLAGEYRQFDIVGDVILGTIQSHTDEPREMYYGMGSYQLNNRLAFSAYYSVFYQNSDDKEGKLKVAAGEPAFTGWQKDLCFTGRLDVTNNWLIKVEYHKINGTGQVYGMHNPDGLKEDWSMIAVKNTFHF